MREVAPLSSVQPTTPEIRDAARMPSLAVYTSSPPSKARSEVKLPTRQGLCGILHTDF